MKLTDVIRRPLITEKTTTLREDGRTLVFEVSRDANKIDIKRAVESLLGSKVAAVRTSLTHGKFKRQGKFIGRRSDSKKAYVTLREGEKLPEFLQGAKAFDQMISDWNSQCRFANSTRRRRRPVSRRC